MSDIKAATDAAIQQVVEKADDLAPGWSARAYAALVEFTKTAPGPFLTEEAKTAAYEAGLDKPHDGRAWGAVVRRAEADHILQRAGYGTTKHGPGHSRPQVLWERTPLFPIQAEAVRFNRAPQLSLFGWMTRRALRVCMTCGHDPHAAGCPEAGCGA